MKTAILFSLMCLSVLAYGQSGHQNPNVRIARPFGISANVGSGNILGLSLDYFVIPQLSLEAGAGLTQYVAAKYHFLGGNEKIRWSPFLGAAFCFPTALKEYFDEAGFFSFPVGVHYIGTKGFSFSIALSLSVIPDGYGDVGLFPWGGMRIGYHF